MNDRLQSEPYAAVTRHFRNEEEMVEWLAHQEPEPEETEEPEPEPPAAAWLSACCAAPCTPEELPYTVCPETGYREGGDVIICAECGGETEPLLQPVFLFAPVAPPKPLAVPARPMRETQECGTQGFNQEVA